MLTGMRSGPRAAELCESECAVAEETSSLSRLLPIGNSVPPCDSPVSLYEDVVAGAKCIPVMLWQTGVCLVLFFSLIVFVAAVE